MFIPVALIDFSKDELVRRFQGPLARAALTYPIRDALRSLDVLELSPDTDVHFAGLDASIVDFAAVRLKPTVSMMATVAALRTTAEGSAAKDAASDTPTSDSATVAGAEATASQATLANALARRSVKLSAAVSVVQQVNDHLWRGEQVSRLSALLNLGVVHHATNSLYLPVDVLLEGAEVTPTARASGGAQRSQWQPRARDSAASPGPMSQLRRISISGSSSERDLDATVILTLNRNGVRFPVELPAVRIRKGASGETRVVQIKAGGVDANLKRHLTDNRMHYSQAVLRSLDSTQIALLLSGYGVKIGDELVPVAQVVEPRPIRYVGNYLAFKMNIDVAADDTWAAWLERRGIRAGSAKEDIIRSRPAGPLPRRFSAAATPRRSSTSPASGIGRTRRSRSSRVTSLRFRPGPAPRARTSSPASSATRSSMSPRPPASPTPPARRRSWRRSRTARCSGT